MELERSEANGTTENKRSVIFSIAQFFLLAVVSQFGCLVVLLGIVCPRQKISVITLTIGLHNGPFYEVLTSASAR